MIFVNASQETFCTTCFLLLKVKDSVIGFPLNMPTSLVRAVEKVAIWKRKHRDIIQAQVHEIGVSASSVSLS